MYVKLGMVGGKIRCQMLTSLNVDMFTPGTAVGSPSFYPMHQVLVNVGYTVLEGEPALYLLNSKRLNSTHPMRPLCKVPYDHQGSMEQVSSDLHVHVGAAIS